MSVIGERLTEYKSDLYACLNQRVTMNYQYNVAMKRSTGNSEYFQQGISNVLAKPHLQHYSFPNCSMKWFKENNLNEVTNWKLLTRDK